MFWFLGGVGWLSDRLAIHTMGAYSITGLDLTLPTTPKQVADVISLHLPLTPQTAGLINKETIAKMKPKVCGR